ncbi:MAG: hypothetical protein IIB75_05040 [Proteobacteria bacterium]|nr:hypothetical protein [Pseudomonadota bacterium]
MTLRRQLLLVSLFTLMLPWAGCEFIRETESALRSGQQQMLAGTARALANSMAQYVEEYPLDNAYGSSSEQLYLHELATQPQIDGYFDDWPLSTSSLKILRGVDGPILVALGSFGGAVYLYVEVSDRNVVYTTQDGPRYTDRVSLVSVSPPYLRESFVFAAEAPGSLISYKRDDYGLTPEPAIRAYWQDIPGGYRVEARLPEKLLGTHLGITVSSTPDGLQPATRISSFTSDTPAAIVKPSSKLREIAASLIQPGMRMIVTDAAGWRIAMAGTLSADAADGSFASVWSRRIYALLVESGKDMAAAEPDPSGRERQPYVSAALDGHEMSGWFRSDDSGRAIVAVAAPIASDDGILGALVLQQGTDAILSLTNKGLARLINVTLIATLLVAGALLGYASWLSRRIRQLSVAAEHALDNETLHSALPSAFANDEIGDLSRSFSHVLRQLGDYNNYLRTLASKLSHELRTPLAIVTSSLENLEHETLNDASAEYTTRALDGASRLRQILSAMSEASRVEELMAHAEPESFDLHSALQSTVAAYRDIYAERDFAFDSSIDSAPVTGSPELLIQMLDKLVDNAVDFSTAGDLIRLGLADQDGEYLLTVTNPGPPLPDRMRTQLFDSMVSMREGENTRHLGLGLYVAKLIAEGHNGRIGARNIDGGVVFEVHLPHQDSR